MVTAHNTVFAFDADSSSPTPVWKHNLGPSVPTTVIITRNILNEVGNISTPVIDRDRGLLYVTNKDYVDQVVAQKLHVLSLATGADVSGSPIVVSPVVAGTVDDASTLLYDPITQAQRPGLLLANGVVYLAFASHEDESPWHGFLIGYEYDAAAAITQKYGWSASQDGQRAGCRPAARG